MIRRICLFGGPGSGKTTAALKLTAELKMKNLDVEYVPEFVKNWAHENKHPISYDQLYVFGKQLHTEDKLLRYVKYIVTDSPVMLFYIYSKYNNLEYANNILDICLKYEKTYSSINFYLGRKFEYNNKGRFHDEGMSKEIDDLIIKGMLEYLDNTYFNLNIEAILKVVEARICE